MLQVAMITSTCLFNAVKSILELESKVLETEERHKLIVEELNWFAVSQSDHFDEEFYTDLLQNVKNEESA